MKIKFIGAAREVTGSKHLITTDRGRKILLDCGMFQGKGMATDSLNRNLGFDPKEIDNIILTHAHIDHSGLIPYMYKLGFRGSVICTQATLDLCSIMLADSGYIQELDVKWYNKKLARLRQPQVQPLYTVYDAEKCMELFIGIAHNRRFYIDSNTNVKFTHTGHMLGSAVANIEITEKGEKKRIAYTGDIGRKQNKILHPPDAFPQCDYLIAESTYGNTLHSTDNEREENFLNIILDTCVKKRGKLIIPAFSVGRTQEVVYVINKLQHEKKLPHIDVFVDSPLAVDATQIFRMHSECMNMEYRERLKTRLNPFGFSSLRYIKDIDESKALNNRRAPCIVISASGMLEAGRIKHHVANSISNRKNTILMVGYCAPETLGARIQEPGLKQISIFGQVHKIKADIKLIESFSGHGDYMEMLDFLSCQDKKQLKKTFLVHGEYPAQMNYREKMFAAGFKRVKIPDVGEEFIL